MGLLNNENIKWTPALETATNISGLWPMCYRKCCTIHYAGIVMYKFVSLISAHEDPCKDVHFLPIGASRTLSLPGVYTS